MKVALFVFVKEKITLRDHEGRWRFEGFVDDEFLTPDWIAKTKEEIEKDNGHGAYAYVALPDVRTLNEENITEDDEILTRVHVTVDRKGHQPKGCILEYGVPLDRCLASDISMDVGEWVEELDGVNR